MRKITFALLGLLAFTSGIYAQKVIVGEYIDEAYESGHPYDKTQVIQGETTLIRTETVAFPGATYIALHFASFELAEDDFVVVRSPDHKQSYVYDGKGRAGLGTSAKGFFATHIKGDTTIVELYSDNSNQGYGYLIDFFGRGYNDAEIQHYWDIGMGEEMNLPEPVDQSRSICVTDDTKEVKCYETSDPAAYDKARAVCRLMLNGNAHCTGWLIGSEGHIMTNQHCIETQSELNSIDFEFMAEGADCATNCASSLACSGTIEASGGTLVRVSAPFDFALVMPDTSVGGGTDLPSTYGYMQLRQTGAVVGERMYIAQHPAGWGKRLAMESTYPTDTDGFAHVYAIDEPACASGGNVDIGYFADTQGGSSGSPVLGYSDNRIIALHHCRGSASCTTGNPSNDDPNRGVPIQDVIAELGADLPNGATCDPPDAPTNLVAAANGDNQIDLSWNAVSGVDSYIIYRSQSDCASASFSRIASDVIDTTYIDTDVSGSITYSYQVKAYIDGTSCEGPYSSCAEATATGACTLRPIFAGITSATNAYAAACGITLEWTAATAQCGTNLVYNIYRDTASGFTPGISNLLASCATDPTFMDQDIVGNTLYYYIVRAEDDTGNGAGACSNGNEDTNTVEMSAFASGPNGVMFFDDVESGGANFTPVTGPAATGTSEPWLIVDGTTGDHFNSPVHSWFCSDQSIVKDEFLQTTNPVSVPNQLGVILRWFHEVEMEDGYDGCVLEYAIDGTNWFDILEGDGASIPANADRFLMNGYNMTISASSNPLNSRQGWSGDMGGYFEVQVDLSDFADSDVNFRWRVGSDTSVSDEGWWIDDIEVLYPTPCASADPAISIGSYTGGYGDFFSIPIEQLTDSGANFDLYAFDISWDPSKLRYDGYNPGGIIACTSSSITQTGPGAVHVEVDCQSGRPPSSAFFDLYFEAIAMTGMSPVTGSNFTGTLMGKLSIDGSATLPEQVDPCGMPSSVYRERWNHIVIEQDLDFDDDGIITIVDMLNHMICPVQ